MLHSPSSKAHSVANRNTAPMGGFPRLGAAWRSPNHTRQVGRRRALREHGPGGLNGRRTQSDAQRPPAPSTSDPAPSRSGAEAHSSPLRDASTRVAVPSATRWSPRGRRVHPQTGRQMRDGPECARARRPSAMRRWLCWSRTPSGREPRGCRPPHGNLRCAHPLNAPSTTAAGGQIARETSLS